MKYSNDPRRGDGKREYMRDDGEKRGGKEDKNTHIGMKKKKNRRADDEFWTKRKSHEIYNWSTGKRRSWLGWANVSRERMERTEFFKRRRGGAQKEAKTKDDGEGGTCRPFFPYSKSFPRSWIRFRGEERPFPVARRPPGTRATVSL